jgi:hypothetical protein
VDFDVVDVKFFGVKPLDPAKLDPAVSVSQTQ